MTKAHFYFLGEAKKLSQASRSRKSDGSTMASLFHLIFSEQLMLYKIYPSAAFPQARTKTRAS
jgi:hypothetical protein